MGNGAIAWYLISQLLPDFRHPWFISGAFFTRKFLFHVNHTLGFLMLGRCWHLHGCWKRIRNTSTRHDVTGFQGSHSIRSNRFLSPAVIKSLLVPDNLRFLLCLRDVVILQSPTAQDDKTPLLPKSTPRSAGWARAKIKARYDVPGSTPSGFFP